jgi:hypothetical protein
MRFGHSLPIKLIRTIQIVPNRLIRMTFIYFGAGIHCFPPFHGRQRRIHADGLLSETCHNTTLLNDVTSEDNTAMAQVDKTDLNDELLWLSSFEIIANP